MKKNLTNITLTLGIIGLLLVWVPSIAIIVQGVGIIIWAFMDKKVLRTRTTWAIVLIVIGSIIAQVIIWQSIIIH